MWLIANEPCHEHHFIYLFPTQFRETESQGIENVSVLYFVVSVQHSMHLLHNTHSAQLDCAQYIPLAFKSQVRKFMLYVRGLLHIYSSLTLIFDSTFLFFISSYAQLFSICGRNVLSQVIFMSTICGCCMNRLQIFMQALFHCMVFMFPCYTFSICFTVVFIFFSWISEIFQ